MHLKSSKKTFLITYKLFPAIALIKVCVLEIAVNFCRHKHFWWYTNCFLLLHRFLEIEVNLRKKHSLYFKKTFLITYKLFPAIALIKVCLLEIKVNLHNEPSLYFKKTILMTYKLFLAIIALIEVCLLKIEVNFYNDHSLYLKKTFLITYKLFPAIALIKVCLLEIKVNLFFFSTKCISF